MHCLLFEVKVKHGQSEEANAVAFIVELLEAHRQRPTHVFTQHSSADKKPFHKTSVKE